MLASASFDCTVRLWDTGLGTELHTLHVDSDIQSLSFSNDGTFLLTNRGLLYSAFLSSTAALSGPSRPSAMFVGKRWVSWNGENFLWFPSEYLPCCVTVQDGIVAFGHGSGRIFVMEFCF
jgi:WD40 repeat protein